MMSEMAKYAKRSATLKNIKQAIALENTSWVSDGVEERGNFISSMSTSYRKPSYVHIKRKKGLEQRETSN